MTARDRLRRHARADHAVNLGTLNQHQNWSFFNFEKPKGPDATAKLRHFGAPSASYLVWYGSPPGGAEYWGVSAGARKAPIYIIRRR